MLANKRILLSIGIAVLAFVLAGCDVAKMVASANPTATVTKTPRPTFTSIATLTSTPADSVTPLPTITPEVTGSPTKKVSTPRPATPKPAVPPPATQPPAPTFPVALGESYLCGQQGGAYYKITARFNRTGSSRFLGGYVLGVFAGDGQFLKASKPSATDGNQTVTIGGNCRAQSWYQSNAEIDVTEFRGQLPILIRAVKSETDHTPISAAFKADFPEPGNYYLQFTAAQ